MVQIDSFVEESDFMALSGYENYGPWVELRGEWFGQQELNRSA